MSKKTLLFGIGNYGRADDALGWIFLDEIKEYLPENFDMEYRYQLQVEDAELASHYDVVYFIDAHVQSFEAGFSCEACMAKSVNSYTSHELEPETILYLTESIYDKKPESYVLGITGIDYELKVGLSKIARQNLSESVNYFTENILKNDIKFCNCQNKKLNEVK